MQTVLMDLGLISILLLIGFYIRVKVKFFQHLYIPVAVIAGIIGLLLGPNVLGRVSPIYLPFSQESGGYANILLVVVFTTLCVTAFSASVGNIAKCSFQCLCLGSVLLIGQTVVGFGLVKILQAMGSDILDGFALLPSTGFYGGHGLGATVAAAWEPLSYWNTEDVISISTTFATIGLLSGIIGGIACINVAARKGVLSDAMKIENLSEEELSGYIPPEKREGIIRSVSNASALEPLSVQLGLVMVIFLVAMGLTQLCSMLPILNKLNSIACVALVSVLAGILFRKTGIKKIADPDGMKHITSTAMELLIVSSIVNTNLDVIAANAKEILVMTIVILPLNASFCFFLAKKWFPQKDWFGPAIFFYGTSNGVVATGYMLLRVADPKSKSLVWLSMAIPIGSLISIVVQPLMLSVAPVILVSNPGTLMVILVVAIAVFCIAAFVVARSIKNIG